MNGWLWGAAILIVALVPLTLVAARARLGAALVAIECASTDAVLALLLLAEGTHSQSFADVALVLAVMSFIGAIAFLQFLERVR